MSLGLLHGTTVVDLSTVGPGSRCAAMLADLGAEVVKVAPPAASGRIRPQPFAYHGGRGTRVVELDLKSDEGRQEFLSLVAVADVVLESFRPGVATRLGIDADACAGVNPAVVYAALTGYGQTGPLAQWPGHDLNYQAMAGMLACQGRDADGIPALPGATVADSAGGGMHAALSICAALVRRARTGEGAVLDVAATDGCLELASLLVDEQLATGAVPTVGHSVITGRHACYALYRCADDRFVAVGAIERKFFANLCRLLDLEDELAVHQYDDEWQDRIRAALADAFARRPRDEWVAELGPEDTCVSAVLDLDEVAAHPYVADRGLVRRHTVGDETFDQLAPVLAGARTEW